MTFPSAGFRPRSDAPLSPRLRRIVLGLLAAGFFVFFVMPALAGFATDWLWYDEIRFESVFLTSLVARALLFIVTGVVAFAFLYGNIRWSRQRAGRVPTLYVNRVGAAPVDLSRVVPGLLLAGALLVALVTALIASAQWMTVLMALHAVPVGQPDPLFGRDIGFYLFRLPAVSAGLTLLVLLTGLSLLGTGLVYAIGGALVLPPASKRATVEPRAARHLGALLALLFVLFGIQLWIVDTAALLYSTTGPLVGASYADVHVLLGGIRLSAVAAVLAAALVVYGALREKLLWFAFLAVVGYVVVGIVFRGLAPVAEQKFVIAPNELARERPYLQQHIAATRRAWRLDSVVTRDLEGDVQLTMAGIRANAPTIDNVRL